MSETWWDQRPGETHDEWCDRLDGAERLGEPDAPPLPLTAENVARVVMEMMAGTRTRATFTFTVTERHLRLLEPRPGSFLDLARMLGEREPEPPARERVPYR